MQQQNAVSSPVTCGWVLWRYSGKIKGMHFPPVWANKGALGHDQACSSHHPRAWTNPCSDTCLSGSYFQSVLKSLSKKPPDKQINKMKIHWASKRELRAFYGEEVYCFKKAGLPPGILWGHRSGCAWVAPAFTDSDSGISVLWLVSRDKSMCFLKQMLSC